MRRWIHALLWLALIVGYTPAQEPEQVRSLTILHVNDLHARLLPDTKGRGGFAQLATVIRRERADSEGALVLDGGDLVQGTPVSTIYEGVPVYEVANLVGLEVSTLGNHEFDYGWKRIPEFLEEAEFPVVSANVRDSTGRLLADAPYVIREVNGIRVAVIGALTADLPFLVADDDTGPWRALPVVETVRRHAAEVRDDADLIVVLGHLTDHEEDAVLAEVPEVSVVVSGHGHGGLERPKREGERVVVRVQAYGRELGRLDLKVDRAKKQVLSSRWLRIPIDANAIPAEEDVAEVVARWEAKVSDVVDVPIGESRREFAGPELKALIERALVEELDVDLAYVNPGGIRDVLPRGRLLARHVWNIMPFDNTIVIGKFKGSRLPEFITQGRPIDPEREYRLATIEFLAKLWARNGPRGLTFPEIGPDWRQPVIDWIKKKEVLR